MRTKIAVTIDSNDNEVTNAVTVLLRQFPFPSNYELEIKPEYPAQYKKPVNKPAYADSPVYCMNFYYHFAEDTSVNKLAQYKELKHFAEAYTNHIKTVMAQSGQFIDRLHKIGV